MIKLSPRQNQVYWWLVNTSLPLAEIARLIGISYKTADTHAMIVREKLGVHSRAELILSAHKPRADSTAKVLPAPP